jgi:hypothetical protein
MGLKQQILGSERPIMTQVKMSQPLHIAFLIVTRTVGTFLSLLCVTQCHNPWVGNFSGGNAPTLRKSNFNTQGIFYDRKICFMLYCSVHHTGLTFPTMAKSSSDGITNFPTLPGD